MSENFVPPNQQRNLRACMVCSVVMTQNVRLSPHTPSLSLPHPLTPLFLAIPQRRLSKLRRSAQSRRQHRRNNRLHVPSFRRANHARRPEEELGCEMAALGWVCEGGLCDEVSGQLPDEVVSVIEEEGRIRYIPRDGSATEAD